MKKVCFFLISILSGFICSAQVLWGVQGGINISKLKIDHFDYYSGDIKQISSAKLGLVAGIVAQVPINRRFDFRPEFNFVQKGGKFSMDNKRDRTGSSSSDNDATFNYVQVALNTVYKINAQSTLIFFGGGLDFNFGIGGKVKANYGDYIYSNPGPIYSPVEYSQKGSADVGLSLITGFKLKNGFFTSVNYTLGFVDINHFSTTKFYGIIKPRGIAVKVGYMIPKKHYNKAVK